MKTQAYQKVSLIIPTFNEDQIIETLIEKLVNNIFGSEIIVIDDGSTDDTAASVQKFANVKLIQHGINRGYGTALATGMQNATRDFVVWMDGDGQHRVEDVVAVMETMIKDNLDYCIGVRGTSSHQESSRKLGKWILRQVVRLAARRPVADFNSGLRGFRRSVIRKYLHLLPKGFGASTTTTLIMLERGYKGAEVPITVLQRVGKSTVKQFRDGIRTLTLILRIFLLFKPLHFFGVIGGGLALAGLGYGLWSALVEGMGFPVLGAVVFLAGLQIGLMGLIMDQISAMRRERFE
jgi:glycosyltransferase involved in cell wall biosynthesis